jgi:hypothetical protein
MSQLYEDIGRGYGTYRRPDPRIAHVIHQALGPPESVVNVGAGPSQPSSAVTSTRASL